GSQHVVVDALGRAARALLVAARCAERERQGQKHGQSSDANVIDHDDSPRAIAGLAAAAQGRPEARGSVILDNAAARSARFRANRVPTATDLWRSETINPLTLGQTVTSLTRTRHTRRFAPSEQPKMGMTGRRTLYLASLVAALSGCTAEITTQPSQFGTSPDGVAAATPNGALPGVGSPGAAGAAAPGSTQGATGAPGATGASTAPGATAAGCDGARLPARAVMVSPRQYVNVLKDLMGPTAVSDQHVATNSKFTFNNVDRALMTTAMLDRLVRLAETATSTLKGKTAKAIGCTSSADAACVRTGIEKLAHRAWKRPVEAAELDQLMALHSMGMTAAPADNGETGVMLAMQALLTAPSALYRTEFTAPVAAMQRVLTPHERAAGLAALLLDSVPDEPLLAAADDGTL